MFFFSTCGIGAEAVFKKEVSQTFPSVRNAFARPGFVSFKVETPLPDDLLNRLVFSRTMSVSLGKIETDSQNQLATEVWKIVSEHHLFVNRVHVFRRDSLPVGAQGFEPHIAPELVDIHCRIVGQSPTAKFLGTGANDIFHSAMTGETVLDVVMIEPNLFFVGTHSVTETSPIHSRYSGGIVPIALPADAVSRAYLKFSEGFQWSGIVFRSGDVCLDIGASPGGCSQLMLQQGVKVLGVDPGAMHPAVLNHPRFTHVRSRIKEAKQSWFRDARWITADMNVAPNYTLDVLEEVITKTPSVRGLLFTLKLIRWGLVDTLPMWLGRIRAWGFSDVRAKQLVFNRQEIMVIAKDRLHRNGGESEPGVA